MKYIWFNNTYLLAALNAFELINKLLSAVFAELRISVLAAPVKYRTNFVDRKSDDIVLQMKIFNTLITYILLQ